MEFWSGYLVQPFIFFTKVHVRGLILVNIETGVLPDVQAAEKYPLHPIGIIPAWGVFTDSVFQTAFFDTRAV